MILRLLFCLAMLIAAPAAAQQMHSRAELVAETRQPAAGQSVTVAFRMTPDQGWHTYWLNPGDAGLGMDVQWSLPTGVKAGPLSYPVPKTLVIAGLMNHVYEGEHAILTQLTIADNIAPGTRLPIHADANWLACSHELCLPQRGSFDLELVVGNGVVTASAAKQFDSWRMALPQRMDRDAHYRIDGTHISIAVPFARNAALDQPYFFAATDNLVRYAAPQRARRTGDWLVIDAEVTGPFAQPVEGLLRIGDNRGLWVRAVPGTIVQGGTDIPVLGANPEKSDMDVQALLATLAAAILGGMLLNLMPCVFPILGLKALSLAKAGGSERAARIDAIGYALGVIASCVALGAIMLALRAGGEQVGWAFQLQQPRVVIALLLLMVSVTANLAGAFELPSFSFNDKGDRDGSFVGSVGTGILTAIVATPCTGPFMAAALGAALLLPAASALLLFAGLGLGLALPFLAIAYIPALRAMMPRSGPWLTTFRKLMAVPMGLTALALLWLLSRLAGTMGLMIGAGAALALLVQLLWIGRTQLHGLATFGTRRILVIAAFAIALFAVGSIPQQPISAGNEKTVLKSEAFSEARLAELRKENRAVFVYFTADWCVTCKVNEAAAIERDETAQLFKQRNIAVLKGDFTRSDPAIARFLAANGRSGVPYYIFYPKDGGAPLELPQILTPSTMEGLGR